MVPPLPFAPPVFAGVQQPPPQQPIPSLVPQVPAAQPSLGTFLLNVLSLAAVQVITWMNVGYIIGLNLLVFYHVAEQQQQLLAQVMALTPADIASLPEEQRANILKLRATLLGGG